MLDRLSAFLRHSALVGIAAALAFAVENLPTLALSPTESIVAGAALTMLAAWLTPITRQYGVGSGGAE